MRGMRRVADQHNAIVFDPVVAIHGGEVNPGGTPDMGRIGHQRVAVEVSLEDLSTALRTFLMRHILEAESVIDIGCCLDNKRRGVLVELIGMGPNPAVVGLFENEGKGIPEGLICSQPHELVGPCFDRAAKLLKIGIADF